MHSLSSLVSYFTSACARFTKLEVRILDSVRSKLDAGTAELWDKQIQAINKIQRLPEGVEVNFYRMQKRRPSFDLSLAFQNRTEELLVAEVQVGLPNRARELTASLWCVRGFLFSIEYVGSSSYFEEAAGMDPPLDMVVRCQLIGDLSTRAG